LPTRYTRDTWQPHRLAIVSCSARAVTVHAKQNIRPDNLTRRMVPSFGYFPEPFPVLVREPYMIFRSLHYLPPPVWARGTI
jgi:hypothetical protein